MSPGPREQVPFPSRGTEALDFLESGKSVPRCTFGWERFVTESQEVVGSWCGWQASPLFSQRSGCAEWLPGALAWSLSCFLLPSCLYQASSGCWSASETGGALGTHMGHLGHSTLPSHGGRLDTSPGWTGPCDPPASAPQGAGITALLWFIVRIQSGRRRVLCSSLSLFPFLEWLVLSPEGPSELVSLGTEDHFRGSPEATVPGAWMCWLFPCTRFALYINKQMLP